MTEQPEYVAVKAVVEDHFTPPVSKPMVVVVFERGGLTDIEIHRWPVEWSETAPWLSRAELEDTVLQGLLHARRHLPVDNVFGAELHAPLLDAIALVRRRLHPEPGETQ